MSAIVTAHAPRQLAAEGAVGQLVAERDPRRDRRHLPLVGIGWLAGALLWWQVLGETSGQQAGIAASVILVSLAGSLTVNTLWVNHNLAIHRRLGPRTGLPSATLDYEQDWVGRTVTAHWDSVRGAREVLVSAGDDWKVVWPAHGRTDR